MLALVFRIQLPAAYLTINPNSLTISGLTGNILLEPGARGQICTDGSNYYASASIIGSASSCMDDRDDQHGE